MYIHISLLNMYFNETYTYFHNRSITTYFPLIMNKIIEHTHILLFLNLNRVYNRKYATQRKGKNLQPMMGPFTVEVLLKNLK